MRNLYIALIATLSALVLLFMVQNLQPATVTLFTASITLPVSLLVILIYVLGMLTGGFLLALIRTGYLGAKRRAESSSLPGHSGA